MTEQSVAIDYDYLEENNCSFSDLQQAAQLLSTTTENQFNDIKNEKWFTRVFDLVTLSNKKDIRLANQIENVAQAQQILMEILVRLSKRDKEIGELVNDAFSNIEKLSQNDVVLAQKLKALENHFLFGLTSELKLDDLSANEVTILSGFLLEASTYYNPPSSDQQEYAHQLLAYLDVQPMNINIEQAIQSVTNIEDRKLLLQICLEYGFLHNLDFNLSPQFEALVDEFDFGNKTIKDLKEKILNNYRFLGISGFTERYHIEMLDEDFTVTFNLTEEMMDDEQPSLDDLQPLTIDEMVHIAIGEELLFENKEVHLNTFLNVEGKLIFKNCIVNYSELDATDQITLKEDAELQFIGCKIICHHPKKKFFIEAKGQHQMIITDSELVNCGYFITIDGAIQLTIQNSYLNQPKLLFVKGGADDSEIILHQCQIDYNYKINEKEKESFDSGAIFDSSCKLMIEQCKIEGDQETIGESQVKQNRLGSLIGINSVDAPMLFKTGFSESTIVKSSSFHHVKNIFDGLVIASECEFTNCLNLLNANSYNQKSTIKNCLFVSCETLFKGEKLLIQNAQFKDCRNTIFSGREVTFEFCEFYNLTNDLPDSFMSDNSSFSIQCFKDDARSTISKCIFDGVQIEENFLIEANTIGKSTSTMVEVKDCEFRNVRTNRSTGIILKQYSYYFGLFDRKVETKPLTYSNCVGLDKVNEGTGVADKVVLRGETSTGAKIGIAIATGFGGLPGLAVSSGIASLLKDDDLTQE